MNKAINLGKQLAPFGIPLAMILVLVWITQMSAFTTSPSEISLAITIDLLLIIPLTYFLLIRKTTIPKTTVLPVLILGIVLGSIILPTENQSYLTLFKLWALPVIEISVISFLVYNVRKAIKLYKQEGNHTTDFFTTLKNVAGQILPPFAVKPVITEIAIIYYGVTNWRHRPLQKNEFSYHKDSGTIPVLIALMFLIVVETFVFHILLSNWSITAAYILTGISIYTFFQVLGIVRSLSKRPIIIAEDKLLLRFGMLSEATIPLKDIESVELSSATIEFTKTIRKLSPMADLDSHNVVLKLKKAHTLISFYGIKKQFTTLVIFVDDKEGFKHKLLGSLGQ